MPCAVKCFRECVTAVQGLRWMVGLHDHQLNGILADEMVSLQPACDNLTP